MKQVLLVLFTVLCVLIPTNLTAQKTYKVVCDKGDSKVKIVETNDRSPNMVPIKGGFPFYQVAEKWVNENYPDGTCDPAAVSNQAQPPATGQNPPANQQTITGNKQGETSVADSKQEPGDRYRNTSLSFSLLFSNLGKVYSVDPPMIPGMKIGIEQLIGTKFYGGTGLHLSTLIGAIEENAEVNVLYNFQIPLFAGYRQYTVKNHWKVEMGVSLNTELRPLGNTSDLGGEIASNNSFAALTRVKTGDDNFEIEFGIDVWLSELLITEVGFQMTVLSIGLRYNF
jgi:hypothetical protein